MVNITMLVRERHKLSIQAINSLVCAGWNGNKLTIVDESDHDSEFQDYLFRWAIVTCEHVAYVHNILRQGTGSARNQVIRESERRFGRGEYLYLSDNDVFFQSGWLETLIDCYEAAWSSGCRVIGAVGHPYHQQGDTLGICSFNVRYAVREVLAQPLQSMLMRWEVWDKYGPFCETPEGKVCQGEDVDFTNKIRADGGKIGVVSPALVVNTGITNSFGEKIPGWEMVKAQCPSGVICE